MNLESWLLVASLALLTVGFSLAWLPLGPIVLGSLLLGGLVWVRLYFPPVVEPESEEAAE